MEFTQLVASEMSQHIQSELSNLPDVDLEHRKLTDGQWCIRTIPSEENSMRFAAIGASLDKALLRLKVMLQLHSM